MTYSGILIYPLPVPKPDASSLSCINTSTLHTQKLSASCTNHLSYPSYVDYCGTVWDPHTITHINLESVQRFGARLTTKQWQATQNQLLHTLNWTPLCVRRKKQKAMVCRRILLGHSVILSSHLTPTPRPNPRTNHSIPLFTPFDRTTLYQSSFFASCVPIWNHLPESVIPAPSSHSFKVRLKTCPIL